MTIEQKKQYYIYEIPGVKIGCTVNPYFRVKIGQGFKQYKILEQHNCIYKASERELHLQKQYGYPIDNVPYYKTIQTQSITLRPDIRAKAALGISKACKGGKKPNVSKAKKGVYMPWLYSEEVLKTRGQSRKQPILQFSIDGKLLKKWDSVTDASNILGINISGICNNISGTSKSSGGYIWKKA